MKVINFLDIHSNPKAGQTIKLIDPPDSLKIINNRILFQENFIDLLNSQEFQQALDAYFKKNNKSKIEIKIPLARKIVPTELTDIKDMTKSHGLKYPIITKTLVSSVTTNSHKMAVALNEEGLHAIENHSIYKVEDHLLQELINHDARIYKIYAIGSELSIQQKQSIPNISFESLGKTHFFFDSQKSFHEVEFFKNKISFTEGEIDVGVIEILDEFIKKKLSLSMFGVDIIVESDTGVYYLVDINYFPGYSNCKNLDTMLKKNILQHANK